MIDKNLIGGSWLAGHLGIDLVMPLSILSRIGGRRATHTVDGLTTETYVASMRPSETLRGHLTFHLPWNRFLRSAVVTNHPAPVLSSVHHFSCEKLATPSLIHASPVCFSTTICSSSSR